MRRPRGPVYLLGRAATPGAAETRQFLSRNAVEFAAHSWPKARVEDWLNHAEAGAARLCTSIRHGGLSSQAR